MTPAPEANLDTVPYVDVSVSHEDLQASSEAMLLQVFPHWRAHELQWHQCKDGLTNKLMRCTWKRGADSLTVLVRAYGKKSELIIDRPRELRTALALHVCGLAPKLHARFRNGFSYGYVEGAPYSLDDMCDPHKSSLVSIKLAEWHRAPIGSPTAPSLFPTLRKWLGGVPDCYTHADIQQVFEKSVHMASVLAILARLEKAIVHVASPVVFCHNDLLSGNIIYRPDLDAATFIDFEYGAYNYAAFDIANHFCEWAGFECDYARYPDRDTQLVWLRHYWRAYHDGAEPTAGALAALCDEVALFALASHLFWGLWALVQAHCSDIAFDYMGYAVRRLQRLEELLPHTLPPP